MKKPSCGFWHAQESTPIKGINTGTKVLAAGVAHATSPGSAGTLPGLEQGRTLVHYLIQMSSSTTTEVSIVCPPTVNRTV